MSYVFGRNRAFRRSSMQNAERQASLQSSIRRGKPDSSPLRYQHLVVKMPDDALYSARGVRFKENIVTTTVRGVRAITEDKRWNSTSSSPTSLTGPLVTFSFLLSEKVEKVTYKQQQRQLKEAFERCPIFQEGLLFDTKEKGVLFPVVHLSYSGELTNIDEIPMAPGLILHQGVYQEVRNIVPETELPLVSSQPPLQNNIGYIILGFKSLDRDFSQVMVDTWKDWTGARYIYMYLPDDLGLRRITFYHRQQPDDLDFFMYLVVVECHGITTKEKQLRFLDFAQRMRLERMSGYISVYSAERKGDSQPLSSPTVDMMRNKSDILDVFLANTLIPRNTRV